MPPTEVPPSIASWRGPTGARGGNNALPTRRRSRASTAATPRRWSTGCASSWRSGARLSWPGPPPSWCRAAGAGAALGPAVGLGGDVPRGGRRHGRRRRGVPRCGAPPPRRHGGVAKPRALPQPPRPQRGGHCPARALRRPSPPRGPRGRRPWLPRRFLGVAYLAAGRRADAEREFTRAIAIAESGTTLDARLRARTAEEARMHLQQVKSGC